MSEPREPVHVRTLTMEAHRAGADLLEVTGRLVDQRPQGPGIGWFGAAHGSVIHDMRVTLYVRHPDLVITAVTADMASHPYSLCPDAVEPLQQLVGLSIAGGFTRAPSTPASAGSSDARISPRSSTPWRRWCDRRSAPRFASTRRSRKRAARRGS